MAAVAFVRLGQQDRAMRAVRQLLETEPDLTISDFITRIRVPLERVAKTYADALKVAGLAEPEIFTHGSEFPTVTAVRPSL